MKLLYKQAEKAYPNELTVTIHQHQSRYEIRINGKPLRPNINVSTIKNAKFHLKDRLEKQRQQGARFKVIQPWNNAS